MNFATSIGKPTIAVNQRIPRVWLADIHAKRYNSRERLSSMGNVVMFTLNNVHKLDEITKKRFIEYVGLAPDFNKLGVNRIACIALTNSYVMKNWGMELDSKNKIFLIPDNAAEFSAEMGLLIQNEKKEIVPKHVSMLLNK